MPRSKCPVLISAGHSSALPKLSVTGHPVVGIRPACSCPSARALSKLVGKANAGVQPSSWPPFLRLRFACASARLSARPRSSECVVKPPWFSANAAASTGSPRSDKNRRRTSSGASSTATPSYQGRFSLSRDPSEPRSNRSEPVDHRRRSSGTGMPRERPLARQLGFAVRSQCSRVLL